MFGRASIDGGTDPLNLLSLNDNNSSFVCAPNCIGIVPVNLSDRINI